MRGCEAGRPETADLSPNANATKGGNTPEPPNRLAAERQATPPLGPRSRRTNQITHQFYGEISGIELQLIAAVIRRLALALGVAAIGVAEAEREEIERVDVGVDRSHHGIGRDVVLDARRQQGELVTGRARLVAAMRHDRQHNRTATTPTEFLAQPPVAGARGGNPRMRHRPVDCRIWVDACHAHSPHDDAPGTTRYTSDPPFPPLDAPSTLALQADEVYVHAGE